jgi:hypothetical protein
LTLTPQTRTTGMRPTEKLTHTLPAVLYVHRHATVVCGAKWACTRVKTNKMRSDTLKQGEHANTPAPTPTLTKIPRLTPTHLQRNEQLLSLIGRAGDVKLSCNLFYSGLLWRLAWSRLGGCVCVRCLCMCVCVCVCLSMRVCMCVYRVHG